MPKRAKSDSGSNEDAPKPPSGLGAYLRQLRQERGLTLREAAALTGASGVSRSYLNQVETGKIQRPRPATITALATAYGVDPVELLRRAGYSLPDTGLLPPTLAWLPPGAKRLDRDAQRLVGELVHFLDKRNEERKRREDAAPEGAAPQGADWVGWQDVQDFAHTLKNEMKDAGFDPDVVVGLGRGGAILAGMIAGALGLKPVRVLDMKHEPDAEPEDRFIEGELDLKTLGTVKTALLVQGEVRSGKSLRMAKERLEEEKLDFRTAALVVRPEVEEDAFPDWFLHVGNVDPPWRRVPGYPVMLRRAKG